MNGCERFFVLLVRLTVAILVLAILPRFATAGGATAMAQELVKAATVGDLKRVKMLLTKGTDVNAKDGQGQTALLAAANGHHTAVIRLLVDEGAHLTGRSGIRALGTAARCDDLPLVRLLLAKGVDVNETLPRSSSPLIEAAMKGKNPEVLKVLLDNGAEVNWRGGGQRTALMYAALSGSTEGVKLLLDKGASVNAADDEGRTALICAATSCNVEVVRLLLQKGAAVNAVFRGATFASSRVGHRTDSRTALNAARECGHKEMVDLLKSYGAREYKDER